MVAGVAMNLLTAFVLLVIGALIGLPQLVDNQFSVASDAHVMHQAAVSVTLDNVTDNSPAARAGLLAGDQIIGLGPKGQVQPVENDSSLQQLTTQFAGQAVEIQYQRNGQTAQAEATLNSQATVEASQRTDHPTGYLGVVLASTVDSVNITRYTWSSPVVAIGLMGQFTALTFQGLGHALAGVGSIMAGLVTGNSTARVAGQTTASEQVSGPVGIFVILKNGSALGVQYVLFILAIVSLSLAIMNILPIPALDGAGCGLR